MSTKKSEAIRFLEKLTGGPVTLGKFLEAVRQGEEMTQPGFAKKLGISKWDAGRQYLAYHEGHGGYARGSHNQKAWLLRVASEVGQRSEKYQMQLAACGKL